MARWLLPATFVSESLNIGTYERGKARTQALWIVLGRLAVEFDFLVGAGGGRTGRRIGMVGRPDLRHHGRNIRSGELGDGVGGAG